MLKKFPWLLAVRWILSSDTDVFVFLLYYWHVLQQHGLKDLWMRADVGNTVRLIPIHILHSKIGTGMCDILPALHALTGNDTNSKVGTKPGGLKADPVAYLNGFGKCLSKDEDCTNRAESYLVQVIKNGATFETMDDLSYWMYEHSKDCSVQSLPPISREIRMHILRALSTIYV